MDSLFFILHVFAHPHCVQLYVEGENRYYSFKELTNFSHQGNKTPWAVSNHSWSPWKTYYYYYKQQVGEESSHIWNAKQRRYSCKKNLAEALKLFCSQEAPAEINAVLSLLHEIFWWWILWNPDIPVSKELLIKTQESHRKAGGLKYF